MQPRYMGRTIDTYPVSDHEMENLSGLETATTIRFSIASGMLGLASSIWTNAIFVTEMTAAGTLAYQFLAPLILLASLGFAISGFVSTRKKKTAWQRIKDTSMPVATVIATPSAVNPTRRRQQG